MALDAKAATLVYIYVRTSQIAVNQTSFYATVRDVLGGTLKLDAEADVGVKVGAWQEKAWFKGGGICASIRLCSILLDYMCESQFGDIPRGELLRSIF